MPNKNNPAGGTAGRGQGAPASGGADVLILHQPAPPVKPLSAHLRRLADLAAARAERDLAAAEAAKAQGDYANFCRLRRLGLSHQMVWCALIAALENVD
jgi:hypothetical protein